MLWNIQKWPFCHVWFCCWRYNGPYNWAAAPSQFERAHALFQTSALQPVEESFRRSPLVQPLPLRAILTYCCFLSSKMVLWHRMFLLVFECRWKYIHLWMWPNSLPVFVFSDSRVNSTTLGVLVGCGILLTIFIIGILQFCCKYKCKTLKNCFKKKGEWISMFSFNTKQKNSPVLSHFVAWWPCRKQIQVFVLYLSCDPLINILALFSIPRYKTETR